MEDWFLKDFEKIKEPKTVGAFRHGRIEELQDLKAKLEQFLKEASDWEKIPTSVKGVFVVKLPGTSQNPEALAIEINPLGSNSAKKRGLYLTSKKQYDAFKELLNDEKTENLMNLIDEVFSRKRRKGEREILEI